MYRYTDMDKQRLKEVVKYSICLCSLHFLFMALKISSIDAAEAMAIHNTIISVLLIGYAFMFQLALLAVVTDHPVNRSVYPVLYILLLASATSVIEVTFVSWNAAVFVLIGWLSIIEVIVKQNKEVIHNADRLVSNTKRAMLGINVIRALFYIIYYGIVHIVIF